MNRQGFANGLVLSGPLVSLSKKSTSPNFRAWILARAPLPAFPLLPPVPRAPRACVGNDERRPGSAGRSEGLIRFRFPVFGFEGCIRNYRFRGADARDRL